MLIAAEERRPMRCRIAGVVRGPVAPLSGVFLSVEAHVRWAKVVNPGWAEHSIGSVEAGRIPIDFYGVLRLAEKRR